MGATSSSGKKGFNSTGEGVPTTVTGIIGNIGVTSSSSRKGQTEAEPPWVRAVSMPPECAADQIGGMSDGMTCVGPNTVMRSRTGHFDSDGVRWGRGFTSGKHVFEIIYPAAMRGSEATVGVGTDDAPLYAKGKMPLVGFTRESWGISLRTKRAFHRNAMVKKFPITQIALPDRFNLYLDADSGTLQFGTDVEYYGTAHGNIPKNQPLYPMVSSTFQGANITIVYRGQGNMAGPPPAVVMVHNPPLPYEGPPADAPPPPAEEKAEIESDPLPEQSKKAM